MPRTGITTTSRSARPAHADAGRGLTVDPAGGTGLSGALRHAACSSRTARSGPIAAVVLDAQSALSLHAHRAMSDVPCEAFMLSALAVWLVGLAANLVAGVRGAAAFVLPWLAGFVRGLVALLQAQRLSRARDHRGLAAGSAWLAAGSAVAAQAGHDGRDDRDDRGRRWRLPSR